MSCFACQDWSTDQWKGWALGHSKAEQAKALQESSQSTPFFVLSSSAIGSKQDIFSPGLTLPTLTHFQPVKDRLALYADPGKRSHFVKLVIRHGYKIQFQTRPPLRRPRPSPWKSSPKHLILKERVTQFLEKNVMEEVADLSRPCFFSRIFVVPKKGSGSWCILDVKKLNLLITKVRFKMETPATIRATMKLDYWAAFLGLNNVCTY